MEPVVVFNHIPKCYGTSMRKYFRQFTTPHPDYVATFDSEESFGKLRYDPATLCAEDFLLGHFNSVGKHLSDRYPEVLADERFKIFTFLREPLEMQTSLFYYTLKKKPHVAERQAERFESLEAYLRKTYNSMASSFPCTAENFEEVLGRYFFLGVADQVETSMQVLVARTLEIFRRAPQSRSVVRALRGLEAVEKIGLPHENKSARDRQATEISDETMAIFRERNTLDYALYDYAVKQLAEAKEKLA
ncbi:MAG: sulfotransferase family 2 domain-containing protein [Chthoniobacterales bacterium]